MRMLNRRLAATALGLIAALSLTMSGCGCGTNHDAPNPQIDVQLAWHRIETPPSYTTLMFACLGTDGLLMDQEDGNTAVTPNDPMCPKGGAPYKLVQRFGTNPATFKGIGSGPLDK